MQNLIICQISQGINDFKEIKINPCWSVIRTKESVLALKFKYLRDNGGYFFYSFIN